LAVNSFSWKIDKATATMTPVTALARVGWGASLGNNLFGVVKLGLGVASGQAEFKESGVSCKTDSGTGLLMSGDYDVIYGAGAMQFTGGLGAVHHKYTWSAKKCGGADMDEVTNLNFANVHGGIRIQF
jgi:hypothetical protein